MNVNLLNSSDFLDASDDNPWLIINPSMIAISDIFGVCVVPLSSIFKEINYSE